MDFGVDCLLHFGGLDITGGLIYIYTYIYIYIYIHTNIYIYIYIYIYCAGLRCMSKSMGSLKAGLPPILGGQVPLM